MSKAILVFLFVLVPSLSAQAQDQLFNFLCWELDVTTSPYHVFSLKPNGSGQYKLEVHQMSSVDSEVSEDAQPVSGCQNLSLKLNNAPTGAKVSFRCEGDGTSGVGRFRLNLQTGKSFGRIFFPEGKKDLQIPIKENGRLIFVRCSHQEL